MVEMRPYAFRNEFTDLAFSFFKDGRRVLDVGLKTQSVLGRQVYLWVWPHLSIATLRPSDWKDLKRRLDEFGDATITCNIFCNDRQAIRFAAFFGFQPLQQIDDRLIMVRKVG